MDDQPREEQGLKALGPRERPDSSRVVLTGEPDLQRGSSQKRPDTVGEIPWRPTGRVEKPHQKGTFFRRGRPQVRSSPNFHLLVEGEPLLLRFSSDQRGPSGPFSDGSKGSPSSWEPAQS